MNLEKDFSFKMSLHGPTCIQYINIYLYTCIHTYIISVYHNCIDLYMIYTVHILYREAPWSTERRRGPVVGHSLWTRPARVQTLWEARIIRCKKPGSLH